MKKLEIKSLHLFYEHLYAKVYNYILNFNIPIAIIMVVVLFFIFLFLFHESKNRWRGKIYCGLLSLWVVVVLEITLLARHSGAINTSKTIFSTLTELRLGHSGIWFDILFNIVLFVPYGYLLRIKIRTCYAILIICLSSLAIETVQLISTRGLFEIADLITNIVGGLCGIILAILYEKVIKKLKKQRQGERL